MLKSKMTNTTEKKHGIFEFIEGQILGAEVVVALSNVGKTFASSVATTMIIAFNATRVIFTGVGGGLVPSLKVGDIVIGSEVLDYEMDCRNFTLPWDASKKHLLGELPFLNWREYKGDAQMAELAMATTIPNTTITSGRIVSGSEFLITSRKAELQTVWDIMGGAAVVEMEGSAVAQICRAYEIPCLIVRAVSDTTTGDANEDFNTFAGQVADEMWPIVKNVIQGLQITN